jgi:Tol biopolymer transport system component
MAVRTPIALSVVGVAGLAALACSGGGGSDVPLGKRWLAFTRADGIYVARADGSGSRRITSIPQFEYQPDWSPDGRRVLLRVDAPDESRGGGVFVVTVRSGGWSNLSTIAGVAGGDPDWSPDGKKLAFVGKRPSDAHFGIYVMNADGSSARRIAPPGWESQYPDWSPDGRRIVFAGVRTGGFDLYVMKADGSEMTRLTRTPGEENWPIWAPDGERIVYNFDNDLFVMDASGRNAALLTRGGGEPSWSPDGRWIAFDCGSGKRGRMCAIRPDGSQRQRIIAGVDGGFPAWKP